MLVIFDLSLIVKISNKLSVVVLLLVGMRRVACSSLQFKFIFDFPGVLQNVENVQVFVRVVPANHIQKVIKVEHIIRKRPYSWQNQITLHQILFYIKSKALLSPNCFVEASENHNRFVVNWHTHR